MVSHDTIVIPHPSQHPFHLIQPSWMHVPTYHSTCFPYTLWLPFTSLINIALYSFTQFCVSYHWTSDLTLSLSSDICHVTFTSIKNIKSYWLDYYWITHWYNHIYLHLVFQTALLFIHLNVLYFEVFSSSSSTSSLLKSNQKK
jgi:hypothetical protein